MIAENGFAPNGFKSSTVENSTIKDLCVFWTEFVETMLEVQVENLYKLIKYKKL